MIKKSFDCFTVYEEADNNVFIHIEMKDDEVFYEKLFEYFFSEDKLLRYCENNKHLSFSPSPKAYTILYRHLRNYIDAEKEKMNLPMFSQEIEEILAIEEIVSYEQGERIARKDKIGKIGEYIFYCLLSEQDGFNKMLCTSTLLEGVNTSAENIIIVQPARKNAQEGECFTSFDFYNLVGRTGRLNEHFVGNAYYIQGPNDAEFSFADAVRSVRFEILDKTDDMDIQFKNISDNEEVTSFLDCLGIDIDEYLISYGIFNTAITAKPLPASPLLEASTAAFIAIRF